MYFVSKWNWIGMIFCWSQEKETGILFTAHISHHLSVKVLHRNSNSYHPNFRKAFIIPVKSSRLYLQWKNSNTGHSWNWSNWWFSILTRDVVPLKPKVLKAHQHYKSNNTGMSCSLVYQIQDLIHFLSFEFSSILYF